MTHDKALKKTGSAPSSDRSRYIPPGLLARGRGRRLQNLYSTQFQIRGNGSSSLNLTSDISSSQGHDKSLKRSRDPNNPLIRSPTRAIGGTPFNSKTSSVTTTNLCDEETSLDPLFSYSRERTAGDDDNDDSSHEDVEDSESLHSSDDADLHPKSQPNHSINQQNVECSPQNAIDANATLENEEVNNNDGGATVSKKRRGNNKCQEIARLKAGDKLPIIFYNNRAVGENHLTFSRHLGIVVRDTNICPIKVRKWKDIGEREKEHMWRAVTVIE